MLELTALAVTAVARACERGALRPGDAVELTWRHYRYDPPDVWFLELHVASAERPGDRRSERVALMTAGPPDLLSA